MPAAHKPVKNTAMELQRPIEKPKNEGKWVQVVNKKGDRNSEL